MPDTPGRLLTLLSLLQSRRDWPGPALADRLQVSHRTVRRDVDRLRELGYPVEASRGPDGGYRLAAGTHVPPLLLDDDQAVALAVALQLGATAAAGIEDDALRALATLRQVLPARLRARVDAVQVAAVADPGADVDPGVLVAVAAAVRAREVLRFDYAHPDHAQPDHAQPGADPDPDGGTSAPRASRPPRRVEPHHVVLRRGRWYLVAWDLDRADWRTFRVDRVREPRSPTGPRFAARELPGGVDVATHLAARAKGSTAVDAWPCVGEVLVDLPAVEVRRYATDAVVEPVGERRCRVVTGAWSWAGLAASLGRLDADVEVVCPPALRRAFADLAQRFARAGTRP